jgi:hypothetical protein
MRYTDPDSDDSIEESKVIDQPSFTLSLDRFHENLLSNSRLTPESETFILSTRTTKDFFRICNIILANNKTPAAKTALEIIAKRRLCVFFSTALECQPNLLNLFDSQFNTGTSPLGPVITTAPFDRILQLNKTSYPDYKADILVAACFLFPVDNDCYKLLYKLSNDALVETYEFSGYLFKKYFQPKRIPRIVGFLRKFFRLNDPDHTYFNMISQQLLIYLWEYSTPAQVSLVYPWLMDQAKTDLATWGDYDPKIVATEGNIAFYKYVRTQPEDKKLFF